MSTIRAKFLVAAVALMLPSTASSQHTHAHGTGDITIESAYSRAMLPVAKVGGGYLTINNVQYVDVNDPEPYTNLNTISGGTETIMTYARYVSDTDHTHWNDYYNITYTGGK